MPTFTNRRRTSRNPSSYKRNTTRKVYRKKTFTRHSKSRAMVSSKAPSKSFKKQMNKYERRYYEKLIIPYFNYTVGKGTNYLQHIPPIALVGYNAPGVTDPVVSCIIAQTGNTLSDNNANLNAELGADCAVPIGGYALNQSVSSQSAIVGRYAKISSSKINFNVQMNPIDNENAPDDPTQYATRTGAMLPHQFRYLKVIAKRVNSVPDGSTAQATGLTADLGENLFLDETGNPRGLSQGVSITAEGGAPQDPFTWLVNKQKWIVVEEKRFTLATAIQASFRPTDPSVNPNYSAPALTSGIVKHPVQKFFSTYNPKVDRRVRWGFQLDDAPALTEPIDMNYNYHHIFLCKCKGGTGSYDSDNWTLQVNGCTSILDV